MNLTIGGETVQNVEFDSGYWGATIQYFGREDKFDIIFSKQDFDSIAAKRRDYNVCLHICVGEAYIIDSLQINDFTMQGLIALKHNDYDQSYITVNFIRRFRMMYFDSTNRKIQLYVSPSDSARHHRRDLQNFRRALLKHYNEGGSGQIPQEIIDLW